jgi:hypothetical protein
MACSSGELHAICFSWAHVFMSFLPSFPFSTLVSYAFNPLRKEEQTVLFSGAV